MATVAVGQMAPAFRLPSGQGPEVALGDYRDKKNVIVWFTKGMACPFCRQQMSQLARVHPQFAARDAEIVEVTSSTLDRARVYTQKFGLRFPYLCDSDYSVRRAWGLGVRSHGPVYYAKAFYKGITAPKVETEFVGEPFKPTELPRLLTDEDMGFFIVDKAGVVRFALGGTYVTAAGPRQIPSNAEILQELDRCAQPSSPSR
ncbi:MAG: peroxiredoxin family protein [Gammaproteobacteria bacterium]